MRFGLRFNSDSGAVRDVVKWAVLAEDLGFDDFWFCQDLMKRDAWVTLTAVAGATRRMRIGTCIVNPFTTSPAEIAMHAATLQEYSEGRFVLGIGPGDPPYQKWVGLEQRSPRTGLAEAIQILRALWRGETVDFEGQVFRYHNAKLRMPLPVAPIPIYIGGQGPRVLELAGAVADGALPIMFPPETIDAVRGYINTGAAQANRDLTGFDLAACVWWSMAASREQAHDALRYLISYYGPSLRAETLAPIGLVPADFDGIRARWQTGDMEGAMRALTPEMFKVAITGSAEEMRERVRWLAAHGATQVNIGPPLGPDREAALRLTAEQVVHHLR
jgi:5,10-methylenetetrahydromethanopterin reductase